MEALGLIQAEEFRGLHSLARVKTALGYKACRSAIMIGDPLNLAQMTQVVRNLATLTTPWVRETVELVGRIVIYFFVDLCSWPSHGPSTLLLYIKL